MCLSSGGGDEGELMRVPVPPSGQGSHPPLTQENFEGRNSLFWPVNLLSAHRQRREGDSELARRVG